MNELQEIPNYTKSLTFLGSIGWSLAVAGIAVIIATVVIFVKTRKQFPGESVFENADIDEVGEGVTTVAVIWLIAFGSLILVSGSTGNAEEVKTAAFTNINQVYDIDLDEKDLNVFYDASSELQLRELVEPTVNTHADGQPIKEVTTTYDDLNTGARYDLVFVFKDNKEPILLKTGNVTDELINRLTK